MIISIPCPSYHYERAAAHENQPPTALRPRNEHGSIDNELQVVRGSFSANHMEPPAACPAAKLPLCDRGWGVPGASCGKEIWKSSIVIVSQRYLT